ncbi:hypothetical protein [Rhizobium rhizogenes]|uniref:Uncharacterized protein n=2 Tax=unclassified Rhizobium TaxID=2613769 RepID=A0AAU7SQN7_9HYPH|nr:hypothetical protein [Rhizobium rhizogenes]
MKTAVDHDERRVNEAELAQAICERDLLLADACGPFFDKPPS